MHRDGRWRWAILLLLVALPVTLACPSTPGDPDDAGADAQDGDTEQDGGDGGLSECLVEAGSSPVGGPCGCIADCRGGLLCQEENVLGYPSGICTALCDDSDVACAEGECELQDGTAQGLCVQPCSAHSECRDGFQCLFGRCAAFCTDAGHCLSGHCDGSTRLCTDGTPSTGAGPLEPCLRNEDCASTVCFTDIGGACAVFCIDGVGDCPEGSTCVGGLDPAEVSLGLCLPTCATTAECPGDFECLADGSGGRVCWIRA